MNEQLWFIILGATLAIGGGWISDEIRAARERSRELKAIKIAIGDELSEIDTTIKNMHEVWESAHVLNPSYITDLLSMTASFDCLRPRLFLIKKEELRKKVVAFYKKLKDTAKKSEGKLGTLANTPEATAEQTVIEGWFQSIATTAREIREEL
jgi:hypothetical protein